MQTFVDAVKNIVKTIPKGNSMSYGAVAKMAGNPKAARAVARILSKNFDPSIPCHRVIYSNGSIGGYNRGGSKVKREILMAEGLIVEKCICKKHTTETSAQCSCSGT